MSIACPGCGVPVGSEDAYCIHCGTAVGHPSAGACLGCGANLRAGEKFCTSCGQPAATPIASGAGPGVPAVSIPAPLPHPASPLEAERSDETRDAAAGERSTGPAPATAIRSRVPVGMGAGAVVLLAVLAWWLWPGAAPVAKSAEPSKLANDGSRAIVAERLGRPVTLGSAAALAELESPSMGGAAAELPAPWAFAIVTRPSGAVVQLDGRTLAGTTPLDVALEPDRRYTVTIERDGYETVRWAFVPGALSRETRDARQLFFALEVRGVGAMAAASEPSPSADVETAASAPSVASKLSAGAGGGVSSEQRVDPVVVRGRNMKPPQVISKVEPDYPRWARERGLATYVVLELVVDRTGRVREARALRPVDPELDRLAAQAALGWRFDPGTREGRPIDVYFNVTVQFRQ